MNKNLKIKIISSAVLSLFFSTTSFANEIVESKEIAPAKVVVKNSDAELDETLGKIVLLKAKTEVLKLETDLEKLKNGDNEVTNMNYNNDYNYNNNYNNNNLPIPIQLPSEQQNETEITKNNQSVKQSNQEMLDVKATAIYGLGNKTYGEIILNGSKIVVRVGDTLPNGYKVNSINDLGITLSKGKDKISLPITSKKII